MEIQKTISFLIAVAFCVAAFKIWSKGDKNRNSYYWAIGWLGYLFCVIMAFHYFIKSGIFYVSM